MMRTVGIVLLALGLPSSASLARQEPSAERLLALTEKIQRHYDGVQDFEARFTQRYQRRLIRRSIEESGRVYVKKPGRMRWQYETPEEKLFVTDGSSSYFYLPQEKQVMVSHEPGGPMGMPEGSPLELLAGRSRLTDSFDIFASPSEPAMGGTMLQLVPLERQDDFEEVELEVRESDGQILRVILFDAQRNQTEFLFTEIRENVNLPDGQFRFIVPSGVDVVVSSGNDRELR